MRLGYRPANTDWLDKLCNADPLPNYLNGNAPLDFPLLESDMVLVCGLTLAGEAEELHRCEAFATMFELWLQYGLVGQRIRWYVIPLSMLSQLATIT